jgi:adenylosuccinate lyase
MCGTVAWLQVKPVEMMSNSTLPLGFLHSNIIMLNLKYQIMGNQRQQKAEKRVKYPRLLGSVDYSNYLCK